MEAKPKRLPWRSWDEWKLVYMSLKTQPDEAFTRLEIWRLRKSLPVRVELTRDILALKRELGPFKAVTTESGRAALAMCIVRAVNLLTGLEQKTKSAMSVLGLAKEMGLPGYLVDLRHSATHGALPEVELLSIGVDELWNWLIENYWDEQYSCLSQCKSELENLLNLYCQKAKNLKPAELLCQYLAKLFPEPKSAKVELQKWLVSQHSVLYEEAWAAACLYFNSVIPKFAEGVVQEALKEVPSKASEAREIIEETLALCENLKLSVTPQFKRLLVLANTDPICKELVQLLVEAKALQPTSAASSVLLMQFTQNSMVECEVSPIVLPVWKKAQNWSARPIGSNTS